MSFDSGTFSGSQKLLVRRFQTSRSLSSSMRFQLIALTRVKWVILFSLQRAGHAAFNFSAFQRQLAQTDVVERLDAFLPGVNLRLVDIAGGGGIGEEQGQRQPWSTWRVASA